jgi:hypothetical protein
VVTRGGLLTAAEEAGYGSRSALGATFNNWRGYGLIGKAAGKASRRGGEGLWHPIQLQLWLALLRLRRKEGASLASLANLPVVIWLMAWPGVATVQAQTALYFWMRGPSKKGERPRGERSVRLRVIDGEIERLAHPNADPKAKRELLQHLSRLTEGTAMAWATPPAESVRVVTAVISPQDLGSADAEARATSLFMGIRFQLFAVKEMGTLRQYRPDVVRFWQWARRYAQDRLGEGEEAIPIPPPPRDPWTAQDIAVLRRISTHACARLLGVLGIGLHILAGGEWTPTLEPPSSIKGISLPKDWGDRGSFLLPWFPPPPS